MRKVLYIVSKNEPLRSDLVPRSSSPDQDVSVLLIHDGVSLTHVPTSRVYALVDDVIARKITAAFPTVSYDDMVRLMFDADAVIAL